MIARTLRRMGDALRAAFSVVEEMVAIGLLLLAVALYRDELLQQKLDEKLLGKGD